MTGVLYTDKPRLSFISWRNPYTTLSAAVTDLGTLISRESESIKNLRSLRDVARLTLNLPVGAVDEARKTKLREVHVALDIIGSGKVQAEGLLEAGMELPSGWAGRSLTRERFIHPPSPSLLTLTVTLTKGS
jgi:hypothetical protein